MANSTWYEIFMEMLYKKYPKKNQLAEALMDLLCIEREAVYRRLRQDVIFPVNEIVKIATAWNISLDETIGTKVLFRMQPMNYLDPSEADMVFVHERVSALKQLKNITNSEFLLIVNTLSRSLTAGFKYLYKFNVFKWAYHYSNETINIPYSQIIIPEKLLKEIDVFYKRMRYVTNTSYILDSKIFEYTVQEIQFFHSIFLITDEDKELIKQDLYALLDYLLEIANTGYFPETKNKVQMYISMLNINTNYSYFYDGINEACRVHSFNMYDNITYNQQMIENFKVWMQKKKRTSIQISETDEKSRIEFFMKQRKLIDSL